MKFLHLANHGSRNVGNGALILGLERVLREDFEHQPSFEPEPWEEYSLGRRRFDEAFVERVNRDCDALLVGAAVTFDGRPRYANTGMRFDLPLELWPRVRKPIVFYGLSHRDWRHGGNYNHLERLRETVRTMADSPNVLFGARNDGTKRWLASLTGVDSERIVEVPDPAVYVPVADTTHAELEAGKTNVVLALNDEIRTTFEEAAGTRRRRPSWLRQPEPEWETRTRAVHLELARAVRTLAAERPLNVVLVAHDPSDLWSTGEFMRGLSASERDVCVLAASGLRVAKTPLFYDLYAKCDVAIALRVHAMNPAIGIGAPVVPVLSQERMRVFMREAGLAPLCVDVEADGLGDAVLARVRDALADPARLRNELEAARVSLRRRTAAFNATVEDFVTG